MKILLVHQNFPAQFKHIAPALLRRGHEVHVLTLKRSNIPQSNAGIQFHTYELKRGTTDGIHPWVGDFESKVIRGHAALECAIALRSRGLVPDVIYAHPGWGESLFLKEVWPKSKLVVYAEFYYQNHGADIGFDQEFSVSDEISASKLKIKNLSSVMHFGIADAAISPTHWQASTYPVEFQKKIFVVHDGVKTDILKRNPSVSINLRDHFNSKISLTQDHQILTFVNRNLEPYRGYHILMRMLPRLLKECPRLRVLIVGGDKVSYGARPNPDRYSQASWKDVFIDEIRPQLSDDQWPRVHFVGNLEYEAFLAALSISSVHLYLTYPFVLSWSLLEAMSLSCAVVASDTAPVREVIKHKENGLLVDFFDVTQIISAVATLLNDQGLRVTLGRRAREDAIRNYDLDTVCLPAQIKFFENL